MNSKNNNKLRKIKLSNINFNHFKKKNVFKINKNNNKIIRVEVLPKFINTSDISKKEFLENSLKRFVSTLLVECPSVNLEHFRRNFETLGLSFEKKLIIAIL